MSVRLLLVDATGPDWIGELDTLGEAIDDVHSHWMDEPEGPQAFVIQADNGFVLATMMRSQADPQVCLTTYYDGRVEAHVCRYILDAQKRFVRTEVSLLTCTSATR